MPIFDMPLDQLKNYRGTNPRPEDFDTYWDETIIEMEQIQPQIECKPAKFQSKNARCYDMWFTGIGGARIYAQILKPKYINKKVPAVLQFHGYANSSGDWTDKLGYVNEGFIVAALDCRGQGGQSQDNGQVKGWTLDGHITRGLADKPKKLLYRSIFSDAAQLARIIMNMPEVDATRVAAIGASQGGALSLACAALTPGLNRISVQFPFLSDYQRVWEMDLAINVYHDLRDFFRHTDPRHEMELEYFRRLGYIDVHHLAHRVQAEVLMDIGLMDNLCPPSTQFAIYNNLKCKKSLILYPDFGHEKHPWFGDTTMSYLLEML